MVRRIMEGGSCDDGAMNQSRHDFADDCLTREGWGMLVSLNGLGRVSTLSASSEAMRSSPSRP